MGASDFDPYGVGHKEYSCKLGWLKRGKVKTVNGRSFRPNLEIYRRRLTRRQVVERQRISVLALIAVDSCLIAQPAAVAVGVVVKRAERVTLDAVVKPIVVTVAFDGAAATFLIVENAVIVYIGQPARFGREQNDRLASIALTGKQRERRRAFCPRLYDDRLSVVYRFRHRHRIGVGVECWYRSGCRDDVNV